MSRHRASDPNDETTIIPKVPGGASPPGPLPRKEPETPPGPRPPDADATTVIPKIVEHDETTTIPVIPNPASRPQAPPPPRANAPLTAPLLGPGAVPVAADETGLIGVVPDVLVEGEEAPKLRYRDTSGAPIRAVRMKEGYASAYSDFTRVTAGSVIRTILRTTGELLITCGLVLLLFTAYEIWGKTAIVDAHQTTLEQQLTQDWDTQPTQPLPSGQQLPPPSGNAIARLYIPRLGKHWVVVEGVAPGDIRYAPGHYPNTAMPGQKGNFAMAGHRMRSVFWDLDQLEVGDKIIVEIRSTWFVYGVVKERIVKPTQVEVVAPVPPGVEAGKLLTLTTCNPKWDNYQRLIIHASLLGQQSRADGPPPEIGG